MQTKEAKLSSNILSAFLVWYFQVAPKNIFQIWTNYLQANLHYFSIVLLFRTLLAPWHRYKSSYGRGFDFKRYLEAWSFNMVARVIGLIIRLATIFVGLLVEVLILVFGITFLIFWILAPFILTVIFFFGFSLIF